MQFQFPFMVPSYINLILKQAVWLKESTVLRIRRTDLNPAQSLAVQPQENNSTSLSHGFFFYPQRGREKILDEGNLIPRDLEVKVTEDLGLD